MAGKHLKNPHTQPKKRKKKKSQKGVIDFFQIDDKPDHYSQKNIEEWNPKDFCYFFKDFLAKSFSELPEYRVVFGIDCPTISFIVEEFEKNNLNKKDVKNFIKQTIINDGKKIMEGKISNDNYASFTIKDLLESLNSYLQKQYLQSKTIDDNNDNNDNKKSQNQTGSIRKLKISELVEKYKKGGTSFLLRNYGIPISATFLFLTMKNKKNKIEDEKIVKLIENKTKKIIYQTNNNNIEKIIKHSILRAPYNNDFKMLDWRHDIKNIIEKNNIKNFAWWKENDAVQNNIVWLFIKQFEEVKNARIKTKR